MQEENKDLLTDKLLKILLWKTRINEEIQHIFLMYFEPYEKFIGSIKVTKPAIFSAVNYLKELQTGSKMYYASSLKSGGISLVSEDDGNNVLITENGKVLDNQIAIKTYLEKNKI